MAEIVQQKGYYSFGMLERGGNPGSSGEISQFSAGTGTSKNWYNGKEIQDDFGMLWYDYGARFYDPALGRWQSVDPLAEDYSSLSPYNYVANNPMIYIDPTGMALDNYGVDKDGNISLLEETDDKYDVLYAVDNSGNKTDTNGDGSVSESDGAKVNDKTILPELSKVEDIGGGKKYSEAQTTATGYDALNIFKFASDNSNVEWSLTKFSSGSGNKYSVSTYHMESLSPGLGQLGISESSTITRWHSHPGTSLKNERSSMGQTTNGSGGDSDLSQAARRYYRNGDKETYPMNVYFPKSKNYYHVAPWGLKLKGNAQ